MAFCWADARGGKHRKIDKKTMGKRTLLKTPYISGSLLSKEGC